MRPSLYLRVQSQNYSSYLISYHPSINDLSRMFLLRGASEFTMNSILIVNLCLMAYSNPDWNPTKIPAYISAHLSLGPLLCPLSSPVGKPEQLNIPTIVNNRKFILFTSVICIPLYKLGHLNHGKVPFTKGWTSGMFGSGS